MTKEEIEAFRKIEERLSQIEQKLASIQPVIQYHTPAPYVQHYPGNPMCGCIYCRPVTRMTTETHYLPKW